MRFLRFLEGGSPRYGRLIDRDRIRLYSDAPFLGGVETREERPYDPRTILPPVAPSKIVCVGRNYRAHAAELGHEVPAEPLLFLKAPSALLAHGGVIELPPESRRVEHEGELAVIVGRPLRRADREEARAAIFGYTVANDVTARDLQKRDVQFTRAKSFDTFCPCGPFVETDLTPEELTIEVHVNGARKQYGHVRDMVFPVDAILAHASCAMTLLPGDLVLTGTPEGVGALESGARVEVTISGIGTLANTVA